MTLIEELRKIAVSGLFSADSFNDSWQVWRNKIRALIPSTTPNQILNLGDRLASVFQSTNQPGRTNAIVASIWINN